MILANWEGGNADLRLRERVFKKRRSVSGLILFRAQKIDISALFADTSGMVTWGAMKKGSGSTAGGLQRQQSPVA
jgi:hypothetical protein